MHEGRRNRAFIPVLSVLAVGAAGVGIAFATLTVGQQEKTAGANFSNPNSSAAAAAVTPTVNCPTVADRLPAIPESAQAEVSRNLDLLNTQITEANQRIVNTAGQGGPNFLQNAILGPLEDKRVSTINRIATAIGRAAERPAGLDALAPCTLSDGTGAGDAAAGDAGAANAGDADAAENPAPNALATSAPSAAATPPADAGDGVAGAQTVTCPTVADKLPAIPEAAQAEVNRNLDLLNTQIAEANQRIVNTAGQGGPNFLQNAILGPLEDKRVSTINRIATAIGRNAARPIGLEVLAPCTLNQ